MLRAEGLGKVFPRTAGLRSFWSGAAERDARWALSGVSFDLAAGESLGVVGHNGAGKSTPLRLVSGLSRPSRGRVAAGGRLACLLDLGAGLVEEWSGEENARAGLRLQGRADVDLESAVDAARSFAEIGAHWQAPLRTWSAGMRLRLAYAVAIAGDPDVFVVDEILAVGDEAFARKCSLHVAGFLEEGGTLLLASHNLYQVEKLCDRAIWLCDGVVRKEGASGEVTRAYRESVESSLGVEREAAPCPVERGAVLAVPGHSPGDAAEIAFDEPLLVEMRWEDDQSGGDLEVRRHTGEVVATVPVPASGQLRVEPASLLPGRYELALRDSADAILARMFVSVVGDRRELGTVFLEHRWGDAP